VISQEHFVEHKGAVDRSSPIREFAELLTMEDIVQLSAKAPEWIVESLIPSQSIVIAAGDSGIGKSPFFYQLGLASASGLPFLEHRTRQVPVVYIDMENGLVPLNAMLGRLSRHLGLARVPQSFQFHTIQNERTDLRRILQKSGAKLVVIDSLRAFDPEVDEKNSRAAMFMNGLRELSRSFSATFLLIHHLKKPNRDFPARLESMRAMEFLNEASGARALVNHTDSRIALQISTKTGDDDQLLVMKSFSRLMGERGPIYIARRHDDNGDPVGYERASELDLIASPQHKQIFMGLPAEFTFKQAKQAYGKSDQPTRNFLKRFLDQGILEQPSKGNYRKKSPPPERDTHGE
jgi:hypothetical protein